MLRQVRQAFMMRHRDKVVPRQVSDAKIAQPSAGVATQPGDLVLLKRADDTVHSGSNKEVRSETDGKARAVF